MKITIQKQGIYWCQLCEALSNKKKIYRAHSFLSFVAVGCLRPLRLPAQGRSADHSRADRLDQEVDRAVQPEPAVRDNIRG